MVDVGLDYWSPVKIYLCGRYPRKDELKQYREDIAKVGHLCSSRWLDSGTENDLDMSSLAAANAAAIDLEDILSSDVIVAFTESPKVGFPRGGRHMETGIGVGLRLSGVGPTIFLVGEVENVFHNLQEIDGRFGGWGSFLEALQKAPLVHGEGRDGRFCGLHPWHKASRVHRDTFPHPLAGQDALIESAIADMEQWENGLG